MSWIESHTSLDKHHKVIRLRLAMRWSKNETVGFLHRFWWTVLEISPSGDITALSSPEVMAEMLDMPVEVVAKALKHMEDPDPKLSFLDRKGGRLLVHDWLDYAGRYLADSKFRRTPEKMEQIRRIHAVGGLSEDCPRIVGDTLPTLPNQPNPEREARAHEGFKIPVRSEEAVALAAERKMAAEQGANQINHDRAKVILDLYPDKARKDGRLVRKDSAAQTLLAGRVAANPGYPWEEHARLEGMNPTPFDALKWAKSMPDPIALEALRKAAPKTRAQSRPLEEPAPEPLPPEEWAKVQASIRALQAQGTP